MQHQLEIKINFCHIIATHC